MKRFLFLLCATVMARTAAPQSVFENADITITLLQEGVWVGETTDKTTLYIVEGDDRALLIDAGTAVADLDSIVRRITPKPLDVVLTHYHYDHAGGVGFFPDIYMHRADLFLMPQMVPYEGRVHFVCEGDVFDLGGRRLEVLEMPGHTPGSIVLVDRARGLCFAGDAFGSGQVWLQLEHSLPMGTYLTTLKKMQSEAARGITKIYCGHYPYQKRALGISYLDDMVRCACSILEGAPLNPAPFELDLPINAPDPQTAAWGEASIVYAPSKVY